MAYKGSYTRGYLTHHDYPGRTVGITFRLLDSVPARLLRAYSAAEQLAQPEAESKDRSGPIRAHMERYMGKGKGSKTLGDRRAADIVETILQEGQPRLYSLIAWVVMPNHVHVLIRRTTESTLPRIVQRWKSWSTHRINQALGRSGPLWFRDYFDRDVRDEDDLERAIQYIELNPVKAGLCRRPPDWPFSSARSFPQRWGYWSSTPFR